MTPGVCKEGFKAPEIANKPNENYNEKIDIFSLGTILYYMCTKEIVFEGSYLCSAVEMKKTITVKNYSSFLNDLLSKMLKLD